MASGAAGDRFRPAGPPARAARKAVRRDIHKMHAFVRFRRVEATMASVSWPGSSPSTTSCGARRRSSRPLRRDALVDPDAGGRDPLGRRGARLRGRRQRRTLRPTTRSRNSGAPTTRASSTRRASIPAMRAEMPRKYWRNLPEAALIPGLLAQAPDRTRGMIGDGARAVAQADQAGRAARAARARRHARRACAAGGAPASAARCTGPRPRPFRGRGRRTRRSCWSASSRATRRISPGGRSSAPPGSCSTGRWPRPGSSAAGLRHQCGQALQVQPRGKRRIHQTPDAAGRSSIAAGG